MRVSTKLQQRTIAVALVLMPLTAFGQGDLDAARRQRYAQWALTHPGDAGKGKALFQDQRVKCATCHSVGGTGGTVGPELTSIGGKFDRPHLIESLLEPSRQIVEGYRTKSIVLDSGRVVVGVVLRQSAKRLVIGGADGKQMEFSMEEISRQRDSDVSIMPTGLTAQISAEQFTDLVAYLETLRHGMSGKPGAKVGGAIQLASGFAVKTIATGLTGATAIETLPDGRLLLCEQTGAVRIIQQDRLLPTPLITLPVDSSWERGVIGVTVGPAFPHPPHVYVCWVAGKPYPHHRISRFTVAGNRADPASEVVLLEGDDQRSLGGNVKNGHQGGAIHFGQDGKLYVGIGEQTAGAPSQRLDSFLGKMLRINSDGSIPDDNPFMDQAKGKYRAIWARGLRNPFTFAVHPTTGLMFINDVGGKFEEVNRGLAGANYGWPVANHGPDPRKPFVGPVHWYPEACIAGGDFVPSQWPQPWAGRYLFADYKHGWIKAIDVQQPETSETFAGGIRRPVDLRFDGQGRLYVLLRNAWVIDGKFQSGTGSLLRITQADD